MGTFSSECFARLIIWIIWIIILETAPWRSVLGPGGV